MAREWQAHGTSTTAHLIDTDRPAPKRSGPRALCGRYPGKRVFPWWSLTEDEMAGHPLPHGLSRCADCVSESHVAEEADHG